VGTAGGLFNAWVRQGRAGVGHWTAGFLLIALGLLGSASLDASVDWLQGSDLLHTVTFPRVAQSAGGLFVLLAGIVVGRYLRATAAPRPGRAPPAPHVARQR
jgi:hypothetical protein